MGKGQLRYGPEKDSSKRSRTLHRDLLLPCGFLLESEELELPPATTANRPQTQSLKKPVVDLEGCFSEEEDWGLPPAPISQPMMFHVEGALPVTSSISHDAVPESTYLPESHLPAVGESSRAADALDPSSSIEEEDAVPEEPEEEREMETRGYLPEPEDSVVPEGGLEHGGLVETSSNSAVTLAPDSPEAPTSIPDSEDGDAVETVEPDQSICRSLRQRKPPECLQYSALGKPLISVVQTLFHSLADAYGEAFSTPASGLMYVPMSM